MWSIRNSSWLLPRPDLSQKMVDLVTERINAQGLSDRITAQQADAQDLSEFAVRASNLMFGTKCRYYR